MSVQGSIQKATTWISSHKREVITTAVVIVLLVLAYRFLSKPKGYKGDTSLADCNKPFTQLSYNNTQYGVLADQLNESLRTGPFGLFEDDSGAADILKQMNTDDDVRKLICVFGKRKMATVFGWTLEYWTLSEAIARLDDSSRAEVNADYQSKNMTFQW